VKIATIDTHPGDAWFIPGDIHFDKEDPEALRIATQVAVDARCDNMLLVGDTFDCAGISRHGRPAKKFRLGKGTIKAEREAAKPWFQEWGRLFQGNRLALTGNHENWISQVQDDYPGFMDTHWPELYGDLFDGWHVYGEEYGLKLGPLLVCHGHRLRGSLAKFSAASVLANYPGQNTLYGHTHRAESCTTPSFKYGAPVMHGAWTIGHMRDIEQELSDPFLGPHAEKHRQGFAIVTMQDLAGELGFQVEQGTIDRDESGAPYCMFRGELYR
jgi:hypothetical protein